MPDVTGELTKHREELTGHIRGSIKEYYSVDLTKYDELVAKVNVENTTAFITRFILHPVKQIFWADNMNIVQLSDVLESRCWERNRDDIDIILKNLGLKSYDPLEIVKRTHGVSFNDFLWIQFEGENYSYKDMISRRCANV